MLKELGFNWNGASCSLTQLVDALKVYVKDPNAVNKASKKSVHMPKTAERGVPVDQETLWKNMK